MTRVRIRSTDAYAMRANFSGSDMMYKILIVEDDLGIAEAVCARLSMWDMNVRFVEDFHNVAAEANRFSPHLVLLDIRLPVYDGYYWCREIRRTSSVPIMFISSAADNMSIVMAMNMGADDFIAKPFDQNVLVAKVQALLRRAYDFGPAASTLVYRGVSLNTHTNTLTIDDKEIPLSKNEYRILLVLMQNKQKIVSREKLMDELWATDSYVDDNTLTVNVGRLRKKLESAGLDDFIKTKFGVGYYIE